MNEYISVEYDDNNYYACLSGQEESNTLDAFIITSCPISTSISSLTRFAMDMAATLLGWVQAI